MGRILAAVAVLAAGLAAVAGHAQTQAPAPPPEPVVVLQAAHLFDGRSGRLVSPGRILVRGKRIEAVGADAPIPAEQVLVDETLVSA